MSGENPFIRPVELSDAVAIAAIYAPYVAGGVASFEATPPDVAEMAARIETTTRTHPWLVYATTEEGVIGYAYAVPHNVRVAYQWSAAVTVYVDGARHRRGIGRALYHALFALLRLQGFYNAYAGITLPNAGSVGLHEAMGYRLVGIYRQVGYKFGAWWDVGWWGMELQPKPEGSPAEPLSMMTLRVHPGWNGALGKSTA